MLVWCQASCAIAGVDASMFTVYSGGGVAADWSVGGDETLFAVGWHKVSKFF